MVGYLSGDKSPAELKDMGIMQLDYQPAAFSGHPEWVREAHEKGMLVNVWTLDSEEDIMKAMVIGADLITTNYPERVFALREKYFD